MDFQIIPEAHASVTTLMKNIDRVVINPIIFFLFACAMVYFIYGLAQYLLSPENEEIRKRSKSQMIWGIVGLFIMVAVFGIMRLILSTVGGQNTIQIQENGDYQVATNDMTSTPRTDYQLDNSELTHPDNPNSTVTNGSNPNDSGLTTVGAPPKIDDYTVSPFKTKYVSSGLCWRQEVHSAENTEYKALQSIKTIARQAYLQFSGLDDKTANPSLPITYGVMSAYDKDSKLYYVWWDIRAPMNNGNNSDCNLRVIPPDAVLPTPKNQSKKPNPLQVYASDASFYQVTDSGVDVTYNGARSTALTNALIQIAKLKGSTDISKLEYTTLEEKYYPSSATYPYYDYWIALKSPK